MKSNNIEKEKSNINNLVKSYIKYLKVCAGDTDIYQTYPLLRANVLVNRSMIDDSNDKNITAVYV